MEKDQIWLTVNSSILKLKHVKYWLTSSDPSKKHILDAIKELEQAKHLLEAK